MIRSRELLSLHSDHIYLATLPASRLNHLKLASLINNSPILSLQVESSKISKSCLMEKVQYKCPSKVQRLKGNLIKLSAAVPYCFRLLLQILWSLMLPAYTQRYKIVIDYKAPNLLLGVNAGIDKCSVCWWLSICFC